MCALCPGRVRVDGPRGDREPRDGRVARGSRAIDANARRVSAASDPTRTAVGARARVLCDASAGFPGAVAFRASVADWLAIADETTVGHPRATTSSNEASSRPRRMFRVRVQDFCPHTPRGEEAAANEAERVTTCVPRRRSQLAARASSSILDSVTTSDATPSLRARRSLLALTSFRVVPPGRPPGRVRGRPPPRPHPRSRASRSPAEREAARDHLPPRASASPYPRCSLPSLPRPRPRPRRRTARQCRERTSRTSRALRHRPPRGTC